DAPSHPDLLDWLAVEFREGGWSVKSILRKIVTSATYRQSSSATSELIQRDPENVLLARGPRFRVAAELVRATALAIAGLLDRDRAVGGPSVRPYQPVGLWEDKGYSTYVQSHREDLYRRSLYTFWQRSVPD